MRLKSCHALLLAGMAAAAPGAAAQTFAIVPARTYIRASNESPPAAVPLVLSTLGLQAGDVIRLERLGDFRPGPQFADASVRTMAVFSGSATLLAASNLHRVPDAIDAGVDFASGNTYYGSLPTDIPEDFEVATDTIVTVPPGATHLFVAAHDSLYHDNDDPDADYAVRITRLLAGTALRVWGGLLPASAADMPVLDVVIQDAPPARVNVLDAVRLARRSAGLD